jgi:predicted transcriptional regulator
MKPVKVIQDPEAFQLFGDESRRRIVFLLRTRPMSVSQIAEELHLSPQTVYHHIQKLKNADIVEVVKEERIGHLIESYYQSTAEVFDFTLGQSPSGMESHKKLVKTVVDGLNELGFGLKYNDETAQEIADVENKINSCTKAEAVEETMAKIGNIDFISRQVVAEVACIVSLSDEQFQEWQLANKKRRELYLSLKQSGKSKV